LLYYFFHGLLFNLFIFITNLKKYLTLKNMAGDNSRRINWVGVLVGRNL
jgi:hypothetical protein